MDRRSFTKLSAFTFAAASLPAAAQAAQKPIGYAAIGLGTISDIFMRACANSQSSRITALVTGHPEKGARYAAMYGIPSSSIYSYETFDRIRDNAAVDAVYIGLPNSMHCEYTVRGSAAGKHVLCEKPMAISSAECRTMIDSCRKANVKLMIGYRVQYDPTWAQAIELIRTGAIGEIESFHGGFFAQQKQGAWRLNKQLAGGGPIMDLGIYPLNAIRYITKEDPVSFSAVVATRDRSGRFSEVEQSMEWTMNLPSGIIASCGCSYGASGTASLMINGSAGHLLIEPAFSYDGLQVHGTDANRQPVQLAGTGKLPFQFTLEADHFSDCIRRNVQPKSPGEEGLKDLLAIESIYQAAGHPIA